jgi:competence protein ComEA
MFRTLTALAIALCSFAAQAAVDVNKASQADLETLRGVGPGLSGKIVEARKAGEFKSWTDLVDRVSGIGPASAARLSQGGLTVAGSPYAGQPAKAAADRASKPVKADPADKANPAPKAVKATQDKR